MMLSQNFLNWKQAQNKADHCSKQIRKREKWKAQKIEKTKSFEVVGHFLVQKL